MRSLDSCLDEVQPRKGDFYVYVLHRPCGEPFYVGCGKVRPRGRRNQRIAFHEEDAKSASTSHKCNVIRKIWADGGSVGYSIAAWLSSEPEMFAKEIELIALLGRSDKGLGPLTNWSDGGDGIVNRYIFKEVIGT